MSSIIDAINQENVKQNIPEFNVGDTVSVMVKVIEGDRERLQAFEGIVIARKHGGISETFTVRRISFGVGVEKTFPIHSPKVADIQVENALFKSACGYEYEEVTEERKLNPTTGQFEMVVTKRVKRQVQPSNTAQIFWLKNRKPDTWRDRREIDNTEALERLDQILGQVKENANETGPKVSGVKSEK